MSHAHASSGQSLALARTLQAFGLCVVFASAFLATRLAPAFEGPFGVISAVGFLLLAGMLASNVFEVIGLPHLTAYILVGVVAGPHALHLVDHQAVVDLAPVNTLALALIALAGGAELRMPLLLPLRKSIGWTTLTQCVIGTLSVGAAFLAASRLLPFTHGQTPTALIGIALLWGVLAVSRSPSATLGILAQTRPDGPVSRFSLAFVMSSDIVVAILVTLTITLVRPLVDVSAGISLRDLMALWHEILGSITLGTTLGILLALYLWLVSGQLLLVLLALGFGLTEGLRYLHFDPLLTFLTAGFVVANLSNQGPKLLHAVEETGSVVFVVFFATAGAHLDVPLVKQLWPVTLILASVRVAVTIFAHRVGSKLAGDDPVVQRWGWASLVSQAGLTLGMSALIERAFPSFGPGFRSLAVATVAVNELVGPILFKLALDRTGESGKAVPASRSIPPPAH
ncbi:MAG TPA: cation:proton antiporter [Polyangiales bacterium]|nr:cation:proton antiporter [Polyangiales bacterium]